MLLSEFLPDLKPKPDKAFQLVKHRHQVKDSLYRYPVYVQEKKDGVFCCLLVRNDMTIRAFSRTGKSFNEHVQGHALRAASGLRPGAYLCEWCCDGISLEVLSGLLNPNRKEELTEEQQAYLDRSRFYAFDFLTISALLEGGTAAGFFTRFSVLQQRLSQRDNTCAIVALEPVMCMSEEAVAQHAEPILSRGGEGVVVKTDDAYRSGHRGPSQTKVVNSVSYDLRCIRVEQGKGKRYGMVANAIVQWKDGRELAVDLGRGFSDDRRRELWEFPSQIVDHILQVDALAESSKGVLRLPKVAAIRNDKELADI